MLHRWKSNQYESAPSWLRNQPTASGSHLRPYQSQTYSHPQICRGQLEGRGNENLRENGKIDGIFGKVKRKYTGEERLMMAKEYLAFGGQATAKKYDVPRDTIKRWRRYLVREGEERLLKKPRRSKIMDNIILDKKRREEYNTDANMYHMSLRPTSQYNMRPVDTPDNAQSDNLMILNIYNNEKSTEEKRTKIIKNDGDIINEQVYSILSPITNNKYETPMYKNENEIITEKNSNLNINTNTNTNILYENKTQIPPLRTDNTGHSPKKHKKGKKYKVDMNILENITNDTTEKYFPNTVEDLNTQFSLFLNRIKEYDLDIYERAIYISEFRVQILFGMLDMVSILFNEQIDQFEVKYRNNQMAKSAIIDGYKYTIFFGFSKQGNDLYPIIIMDNINYSGEDPHMLKQNSTGLHNLHNYNYLLQEIRKLHPHVYYKNDITNYSAIISEWVRNFISSVDIEGKVLLIHSLSTMGKEFRFPDMTPRQGSDSPIHYLNIPPIISRRIFPFAEFGLPALMKNIISGYFLPTLPTQTYEKSEKLIECILNSLSAMTKETKIGCFCNFFQNLINFRICEEHQTKKLKYSK